MNKYTKQKVANSIRLINDILKTELVAVCQGRQIIILEKGSTLDKFWSFPEFDAFLAGASFGERTAGTNERPNSTSSFLPSEWHAFTRGVNFGRTLAERR